MIKKLTQSVTIKTQELFKDNYFRSVFILFIIGAFLRLYKIGSYVTFLGDQGRDVIVLRRILTFEHFPAIGAPTSVGQVYLGPFYYYFIAPWLLLFNFHPLGPAIGVAIISSLFILFAFYRTSQLFDKRIALLLTGLIAFSPSLVDLSRYSWNPNLLPVFTLLYYFSLLFAVRRADWRLFILSGSLFSFCIQFHYIALVLAAPTGFFLSYYLWQEKKKLSKAIKNILAMTGSAIFFSIPLFIFDLRHDFLNSRNFIKLFSESNAVGGSHIETLLQTFSSLNKFSFNIELPTSLSLILFMILIASLGVSFYKDRKNWHLGAFFLFSLLGVSLYSGPKYIHYFTVVYSFYYLTLAYLAGRLLLNKLAWIPVLVFLIFYINLSIPTMRFFFDSPSNQIAHAESIATIIKNEKNTDQFQVTGLPDKYSDSTYRYFLEKWGVRALEHDSLDKADELFVVCENDCKPIGDPMWDIAFFAPNKFVGEWTVGHDRIYKLVR